MKLATLLHQGRALVAVISADGLRYALLSELYPEHWHEPVVDMTEAIVRLTALPRRALPSAGGHALAPKQLLAPLPRPPRNVFCVGKNYRAHVLEFSKSGFEAGAPPVDDTPKVAIFFTKPWTSITGPADDIPLWPGLDQAVDYEAELTVIIGRPGRNITRARALEHVFGYTILNDVTARDVQRDHQQWFLGKSPDGFAPTGPWIVTADELNVSELEVSCRINGETRQSASTSELIFDVPCLIETLSRGMELLPGDMIATGTPAGVGVGFKPPKFLKDGDLVETEISQIGVLRNTVRRAS
jgi:2-keto-4-pentenoate hydratase/2-oxohepta-3-ene-1,7-dioic acid hydratase in catechol pathway